MDQKDREEVALFRMSLIGDLVIPGLTTRERAALLRDKAGPHLPDSRDVADPYRRVHVSRLDPVV